MATNYNNISREYKKYVKEPYHVHFTSYTFLQLAGKVSGKAVLDLACGDGTHARHMRREGAKMTGVDISEKMIKLARQEEAREPLGIEYQVQDVLTLSKIGEFDLVTAAYLLNYAKTKEELLTMCRAIHANLKDEGRFVCINANHGIPPESYPKFEKYGFSRSIDGPLQEGNPVTTTLFGADRNIALTNYYFNKTTHEWALQQAGFKSVRWSNPVVSQEGKKQFGEEFWQDAVKLQTIIGIECVK